MQVEIALYYELRESHERRIERSMSVEFPFMFKPENIARYEAGDVVILDRRVYPFEIEFVRCTDYEEAAKAIEDMVTQSYGPGFVAGYAMASAARYARRDSGGSLTEKMEQAGKRLIATRPTNHQVRLMVTRQLAVADKAIEHGDDVEEALLGSMDQIFAERHATGMEMGRYGAEVLEDGDVFLNHCWAELGLIYTVYVALEQGKQLTAFCSETRPYFQGSRLTATALTDMGVPTTVVTDNMPGYLMYQGRISKFLAGADRVSMDGYAVNKIGTFPHALAANYFDIPTYIFCPYGPDSAAKTIDDIDIEERDPQEVLMARGLPTTDPRVSGYYPAFDATPPQLITGLITDRGLFTPDNTWGYYEQNPKE